MKKIIIYSSLLLAVSLNILFSQSFEQTGGPFGGRINSMAIDSVTGNIFAGTNGSGIFVSTNQGDTWTLINSGLSCPSLSGLNINVIAINPSSNQKILISENSCNKIYRTLDGGKNWISTNFQFNGEVRQIVFIRQETGLQRLLRAFTLTSAGMYVSTDEGATWLTIQQLANQDCRFLAADPDNTKTFYLETEKGLLRSTDFGQTWTQFNKPDSTGNINSMVFENGIIPRVYACTWNGVFVSTDQGAVWKNITAQWQVNEGFCNLQMSASKVIYVTASHRGVFKFVGFTPLPKWETMVNSGLVDRRLEPNGRTFLIDPRPNKSYFYYGSYEGGVYLSTNEGKNWSVKNNGLLNSYIRSLAIDPLHPDTLFAGTNSTGIFKSTNGGKDWIDINSGIDYPKDEAQFSVLSIACDYTNSQIIYAGVAGVMDGYGLFRSTDGGTTWSQSTFLPIMNIEGSHHINDIVIDPTNSATVFAAGNGNIFKSTDRGSNWKQSGSGLEGTGTIVNLKINPKDNKIMYASSVTNPYYTQPKPGGIWKSTDGGSTWKLTSLNSMDMFAYALTLNEKDPNIIYVSLDNNFIFTSFDGGNTWRKDSAGLDKVNATYITDIYADSRNTSLLYCADVNQGVFKSRDAGKTWNSISTSTLKRNVLTFGYESHNPGLFYVGSLGGGVYRMSDPNIFVTSDSLNFGSTPENVQKDTTIKMVALGFGNLSIKKVYIMPNVSDFSIVSGGGTIDLKPGSVRDLKIRFLPTSQGIKSSSLFIETNDADRNPLTIALYGRTIQDQGAPEITHTAVTSVNANSDLKISFTITDALSNLKSASVYYRTSSADKQFLNKLDVTINQNVKTQSAEVTIPAAAVTSDGLDYRITGSDIYSNTKTYVDPATSLDYISVPVTIQANIISSPATTAGNTVTAYRIFSIPFKFLVRTASSLFGKFGEYKKAWRLRNWDGSSWQDGEGVQLEPGKGYFLITTTSDQIKPASTATSSKLSEYQAAGIQLSSGWNLVGNPFNFSIPLSALSLANGKTLQSYAYTGSWVPNQPFLPWSGLAVYTSEATSLKININNTLSKNSYLDDKILWAARIKINDGETKDEYNYFGELKNTSSGEEEFRIEPPAVEGLIRGYFTSEKINLSEVYKKINKDGKFWDFTVELEQNKVFKIELDELQNIPVKYSKYIFDLDRNIKYNLSFISEINTFSGNGKRIFRILIGSEEYINNNIPRSLPSEFTLSQNYPNPFNPNTAVTIGLPTDSHIKISLYDTYGRLVREILNENKLAGYYEIPINCANLSSGVYYYKMEAAGKKSFTDIKKMILLK